jgi:hypothetical protein
MVVFTRPQPHGSRGGGQRQQRLPRTDAGPRHRPPQQRRPHTSGGGGPAAAVPALGAPGPTSTARHQRSQVLGALRPIGNGGNRGGPPHFAPPATKATGLHCPGCFLSREGCGGPLPPLPGRASCPCAGDIGRSRQSPFVALGPPEVFQAFQTSWDSRERPARASPVYPGQAVRRTASPEMQWSGSSPS